MGIPDGIGFDPSRDIVHHSVLPGAEPQRHNPQTTRAGGAQHLIERAEFKPPLLGLDFIPVDRKLDHIRVHCLHDGPDTFHAIWKGAVVADLAPHHDERLAIDHESVLLALLHQLGNGLVLSQSKRKGTNKCQSQLDKSTYSQSNLHPTNVYELNRDKCLEWAFEAFGTQFPGAPSEVEHPLFVRFKVPREV